jgi:acyl carrier protein
VNFIVGEAVRTQTTIEALREAVSFVMELARDDVTATSTLDDLGIDSLVASQILIEIEIRIGHEVPFEVIETIDEIANLAELAEAIDRARTAADEAIVIR